MASNQTYEVTMKSGGHPETLVITPSVRGLWYSDHIQSQLEEKFTFNARESKLNQIDWIFEKQFEELDEVKEQLLDDKPFENFPFFSSESSTQHFGPLGNQGEDEEVPMETDQLAKALMMSTPVVKEALEMGLPRHLIEQKVLAKILSDGHNYTNVHELIKDLGL